MNQEGAWIVKEMKDAGDELTIVVAKCANCDLGEAFDCPEIARLGCDHDLAGYPVIVDKVNAEFRRPHTLAKGDEYCDFHFYRKGTAPDTEHLNKYETEHNAIPHAKQDRTRHRGWRGPRIARRGRVCKKSGFKIMYGNIMLNAFYQKLGVEDAEAAARRNGIQSFLSLWAHLHLMAAC